jgi:hypothetical protein
MQSLFQIEEEYQISACSVLVLGMKTAHNISRDISYHPEMGSLLYVLPMDVIIAFMADLSTTRTTKGAIYEMGRSW